MTDTTRGRASSFWQEKRLDEMTDAEWEALCDRCGRCCLEKVEAADTHVVYPLDIGCELLDPGARCSDYVNRQARVPGCVKVTAANIHQIYWLPPTCAYKRLELGQPLEWWHPLVSGDPHTVQAAGISVVGRFIEPRHAGTLEYHTVDWALDAFSDNPRRRWKQAMFGGINASIPTPFDISGRVDLDLMASHCFWLLSNGCHALSVMDSIGEVAALSRDERMLVMQGLVARGVPPSKLLVCMGPGGLSDRKHMLRQAIRLGIRGALVNITHAGRVLPADVLSGTAHELLETFGSAIHFYISFAIPATATVAAVTALDALMSRFPGRLRGIRDETPNCSLGLACLEQFCGAGLEVYATDPGDLMPLVQRGGAGLIGPMANLLSRPCATVIENLDAAKIFKPQRTISHIMTISKGRPAVPVIKALLARHTRKPEWNRMRLPLRPLGLADREALFQAVDAGGLRLHPMV